MKTDLEGKIVLVSGGAGGLGTAHARMLVDQGAFVAIGDVREDEVRTTADGLGESCLGLTLDVTAEESWKDAIDAVQNRFGGLDGLVNNAGIVRSGLLEDTGLADFESVIRVNLTGTFLGIRSAIPALRARGGGSIVNISSIAGMHGVAGVSAYSASKFGIRGLTRCAALEVGHDGIRVNSIHPGGVDTEMTSAARFDSVDKSAIYGSHPIPRIGNPEEVARLVVFLLSSESSYCTGSEFVVDGGASAGAAHAGLNR